MKKVILMLVMVLMISTGVRVSAEAASGTCEDGLTWEITNSVLYIRGNGAMKDYPPLSLPPWDEHMAYVRTIVIEEGVTRIGKKVTDRPRCSIR